LKKNCTVVASPVPSQERVRVAPNVDHTRSAIILTRLIDRRHH